MEADKGSSDTETNNTEAAEKPDTKTSHKEKVNKTENVNSVFIGDANMFDIGKSTAKTSVPAKFKFLSGNDSVIKSSSSEGAGARSGEVEWSKNSMNYLETPSASQLEKITDAEKIYTEEVLKPNSKLKATDMISKTTVSAAEKLLQKESNHI